MILSNAILLFVFQKDQYLDRHIILRNFHISSNLFSYRMSNKYLSKESQTYSLDNFPSKFIYRNLWQKLVNDYIQETVFLSTYDKKTINYDSKLRSMGLSVYDTNQHRKFLNQFGKYIVNKKINVLFSNDNYNVKNSNNLYLKYKWIKSVNFNFFDWTKGILSLFNSYKLSFNTTSLPIFILVNANDELIMSESVNQMYNSPNTNIFYKNFIASSENYIYTCLMFVNYRDALEYKNFIEYRNLKSTQLTQISIIPSSLDLYHRLLMYCSKKVDFRLVPDLTEISNLIGKYRKYKNISFGPDQKYSCYFFQGQPLYQIQLKGIKNSDLFKNKKQYFNENTLFLNYSTALNFWRKFTNENSNMNLPRSPRILVSNLESFIKIEEHDNKLSNCIFLPSYENYVFAKKYVIFNLNNRYHLKYWLLKQSANFKSICFRIIWSLTSRQPNNW
uniref:Ycf80 n=1 Tax=Tolypiocladia glomerulata TaxID=860646 RepID=A0A1Z1MUD9_9FLOR|nr:hypothetical protein [Tolypiocladia glomerulata]ARW69708.1 hypothetical protein [Tolypiocladia glomerulata]